MAKLLAYYRCAICGNIVHVLHVGGGTLVCCGQPMTELDEQTADSSLEKHVPVVERRADGYAVTVGSVAHPMLEKHWIQWIELEADGVLYRKMLAPGDSPAAFFAVPEATTLAAREHCNLHGLWRS